MCKQPEQKAKTNLLITAITYISVICCAPAELSTIGQMDEPTFEWWATAAAATTRKKSEMPTIVVHYIINTRETNKTYE